MGLAAPGVVLALATWTPLLVLSPIQGVVIHGRATVPCQVGVSTPARLLVAIPLLFAAEAWIDPRRRNFGRQIGAVRPAGRFSCG